MALSVYASTNSTDGTLTGWTNPTYVYSDDGTNFATRVGTTKNEWYGTLFGFDLSSLPDTATINTVTLTAEWKNSAADTSGPVLFLGAKSGGTEVGSGTTDTTGQTTFEVTIYAPTGLTAANLKATGANGFWAILRFRRTDNTAHTASVDYVKAVIDYSVAYTLAIDQDSLAENGQTVGLGATRKIGSDYSSFTLTEQGNGLLAGRTMLAEEELLDLSEQDNGLTCDRLSISEQVTLSLAGQIITLTYGGGSSGSYELYAYPRPFYLNGNWTTLGAGDGNKLIAYYRDLITIARQLAGSRENSSNRLEI